MYKLFKLNSRLSYKFGQIFLTLFFFILFNIQAEAQKEQAYNFEYLNELSNANPQYAGQICDSLLRIRKFSNKDLGIIDRIKGKSLYFSGKFEEAGKYFTASIRKLSATTPNTDLGLTLIEQAKLFRKLKMFPQAIKVYNSAYKIFASLNDKNNLATVLNEWGVVYELMEDYPKAIDYYKNSLKLKQELHDSVGIAYSNGFLSYVTLLKGDYKSAEAYGIKSFKLFQLLNNQVNKALQSSDLALVYEKMGNFSKAIQYLQYSDSIAEAMNYPDLRSGNYDRLALIYASQKQFEKAYAFRLKFEAIKDSLFTANSQKAIAELNIQYQTSEKDRKLLLQKSKLDNQRFLLLLVLILLLMGAGLLIYILRNKKQKELQLKKDAAYQQQILQMEARNSLQQDRLRISRDLHDNIGSYLTYIKSTIEDIEPQEIQNKEQLPLLKGLVSDTIAELRRTVWLINKPSINLEEWVIRLKEHFKNINQLEINSSIENSGTMLSAQQATTLFRIVQEAINNALKYAQCSRLTIQLEEDSTSIFLFVKDNGCGFNLQSVNRGYGLENMKQRASEINGLFSIDSSPGKGTEIKLKVNLQHP